MKWRRLEVVDAHANVAESDIAMAPAALMQRCEAPLHLCDELTCLGAGECQHI